ncbi:MAG: M23 family metallopeptidase [Firmicutes bacterium]|nr:M23 family metallopeptidase [Bacillota bacterium]
MVNLTNSYTNASELVNFDRLLLADFLAGMAYAELYDNVKDLSDEEKLEAYKAFMVSAKALIFNIGGYDYQTKEITIQSGSGGAPYCDVDNGCIILKNNGATTYVSKAYADLVQGEVITSMDPLPLADQTIIFKAYNDTRYEIVTPKSLNTLLEKYNYGNVKYNQDVVKYWVNQASKNKSYDKIVPSTDGYSDLKIYNLEDYAMKYNYSNSSAYWWPIGGSSESNGVYSGAPTTTSVSSKFGPRTIQGSSGYHYGIDISGALNQHVIIATKSGTVTTVSDGCASVGSYGSSCGGGYGNYVIIDHGDGTSSVYAHMYKDSIVVTKGATVKQGQKLGMMGSSGSSTGSHLHFEIRVSGQRVDPLQYVSASNPRPSSSVTIGYQEGNSNKQSVCLTLRQSGFSNNAVAALMVNMESESNFRTTALGDSGTSYGLCQWHNGRYTKLKNYCGSEYSTVKCQLSYLIYELQNSYKGVYNYLLSNNSAWKMAEYFCIHFEVPANRYTNCPNRANRSAAKYEAYVNNGCQ